jgi:hypothetical protein
MLTPSQARSVVEAATAAPSVHNSQPWLFAVLPDRVQVRADRSRLLPRQDPDGRELHISCGAASLNAQLALRALGMTATPTLLPTKDVVAELALVHGTGPTSHELRLLAAVPRRHTDRSAFSDEPVSSHVLHHLEQAAEAEGAWLQVLSTGDMLELAVLQAHAQATLRADDGASRERAEWARSEPRPTDGLPADLVPGWSPTNSARAVARETSLRDVVLVLGTAGDEPADWVSAGRGLARVLLEATDAGLVAAPATLALELPTVRDALRGVLALHGAPQMVLRAGYPVTTSRAVTGRRPVDQVLITD